MIGEAPRRVAHYQAPTLGAGCRPALAGAAAAQKEDAIARIEKKRTLPGVRGEALGGEDAARAEHQGEGGGGDHDLNRTVGGAIGVD